MSQLARIEATNACLVEIHSRLGRVDELTQRLRRQGYSQKLGNELLSSMAQAVVEMTRVHRLIVEARERQQAN